MLGGIWILRIKKGLLPHFRETLYTQLDMKCFERRTPNVVLSSSGEFYRDADLFNAADFLFFVRDS